MGVHDSEPEPRVEPPPRLAEVQLATGISASNDADQIKLGDVIDAAEAAVMLGVTRQHVVHLFHAGRLPGKRLTATWVTTRQAVEAYARDRRPPGRPKTDRQNNT